MKRILSWLFLCMTIAVSGSAVAKDHEKKSAAAEARFDVMEYDVEGNTLLADTEIEKAIYPYLGEGKTIDGVKEAVASLKNAYYEAGYQTVLVDIPEQKLNASGIVKLKVTEGSIGKVRVAGSHYYSQGRILEKVPSLAQGAVPYFPNVQKELAGLNQQPDRKITPVLRQGSTPGTVDVDLHVEDKLPLHASLELNNRYSPNTTHTRLNGMLRYDNLWQREHSLTFQYQIAPERPSDAKVLSLSYLLPVPDSNKLLALYAVRARSAVASVGDTTVIGDGDIYGARAILPLPQRGHYYHTLSLGADYKDFKAPVTGINNPVTYLPFALQYNGTLAEESRVTQFGVGANFALRGLREKRIDCSGVVLDQFECKRHGASGNYFFLKAELSHTQKLAGDMSLYAKLDTQIADQPLIPNEQFSGGGAGSVRGYLESEILGDSGVHGTLEWRSASYAKLLPGKVDEFRFAVFMDGAHTRLREPLPGEHARSTLSGAGLGFQIKAWSSLNASFQYAWPFKNTAYTSAGHPRANFKVSYEF